MTEPASRHDLLILGASFTGVELLRRLRAHRRGRKLDIAVVDRQTLHPYIPLGHELVCGRMATGIEAGTVLATARYVEDRLPVPGLEPTRYIDGEITAFDATSHTVTLADGRRLSARFVVIALGSEVAAPAALPGAELLLAYKSAAQFETCRARVVQALSDADEPTVLVAGGGISGVEIAGELAHLRSTRPPGWQAPRVVMVHAGDHLLPALTPRAGRKAEAALREQGVELHLRTRLRSFTDSIARLDGPEGTRELPCTLGFWAGGLQPPPITAELGLPLTEDGWLRVIPTLQCMRSEDNPEIFAGGDIARVYGGAGRWPTMQRAIEAIFAAKTIAHNILELARRPPGYPGKGVPPLHPHRLWSDFPHGVSVGGRSLIVYGPLVLAGAGGNIWFRRFLMRMYMRRYS